MTSVTHSSVEFEAPLQIRRSAPKVLAVKAVHSKGITP